MCKFQPHRYSFQSKLFDTPICILLTLFLGYILLKLFSYTIQTISIPPPPPPPPQPKNSKPLRISKTFPKLFEYPSIRICSKNPYIDQTVLKFLH